MAGCAITPDTPSANTDKRIAAQLDRSSTSPEALLDYYWALSPMSANELMRERHLLSQLGSAADTQLRQAMVLGHPRQPNPDLARANNILEQLLQSNSADTYYLRPIIHLLADSYAERLRQENRLKRQNRLMEKQHQQLLDARQKATELQDKLEGLANIERSFAPRSSRPIRPPGKP
jgi:predicted ribosome quality control (RQC) complex YloA/Tae2 family protein